MKGLNYIIKNTTNATFFSLLSGGVFVSEIDNAQRFTSEADAMLCMEEHIDGTDGFNKFGFDVECFIAPLIETGMSVKYREPSDAEEAALIFTVTDATNQDWILMQAINSTLAMPPIEGINSIDLTVICMPDEKTIKAESSLQNIRVSASQLHNAVNVLKTVSENIAETDHYLTIEQKELIAKEINGIIETIDAAMNGYTNL